VSAQAQGMGYIPVLGEIGQEVLCPAPRGVRHAMYEKDWRGTRIKCWFFLDGLQPHTPPLSTMPQRPVKA